MADYGYTGGVQSFLVPKDGIYRLEAWGGQGQLCDSWDSEFFTFGGLGGYASGYTILKAGTVIYICCGGGFPNQSLNNFREGGSTYNGGRETNETYGGNCFHKTSGAGCTSITTTNRGELYNFNSYRNEVLLVAGGGSGGVIYRENKGEGTNTVRNVLTHNGVGGGDINAYHGVFHWTEYGRKLARVEWELKPYNGGFGRNTTNDGGGSGGGWQSGSAIDFHNGNYPGFNTSAGGSSYVGGVHAFSFNGVTYSPSTVAGQRYGHGMARITYIVPTTYTVTLIPAGEGTVSGGGVIGAESNATVIATPNKYYKFDGWYDESGTLVSPLSPYTFNPTRNITLTARFSLDFPIMYYGDQRCIRGYFGDTPVTVFYDGDRRLGQ